MKILKNRFVRFYQIAPFQHSKFEHAKVIGAINSHNKSLEELELSVKKAKSGKYEAIYLAGDALLQGQSEKQLEVLKKAGLPLVLQINAKTKLHQLDKSHLVEILPSFALIHFVFDKSKEIDFNLIQFIEQQQKQIYYTIICHRMTNTINNLKKLPEKIIQNLYFCFPYHLKFSDPYFNCDEIHQLTLKIQKQFPQIKICPNPGIETYDPRIPGDRNLEPMIPAKFQQKSENPDIKISVIIPSYNNRDYLLNTLKHLFAQTLNTDHFEIILIDDGSTDNTQESVEQLLQDHLKPVNFSYIFYRRVIPRKMGDNQFRAGLARNLGAKFVQGDYIAFLDSDILTPPQYLEELLEKHKKWDVIQGRREFLKKEVSTEFTRYEDIKMGVDTYIPDDRWWEEFHSNPKPWMEIENHWRYVCTHSLSLATESFLKVGRFRKNYSYYGYEDTEIGFDLAEAGMKFHLNKTIVYHLDHRVHRSEYKKSFYRKRLLLRQSAMTFYHNTLDRRVYHHLSWLFKPMLALRIMMVDSLPQKWREHLRSASNKKQASEQAKL